MLSLRFLQAIGGGFATVICLATVRDIYPVEQLGRRFATVTMVLLVAPLVAPALGAAVLPLGWEMIFVLKAVYAAVLLGAYAGLVPETRPGRLGNLSLRSVFRQCFEVVQRRVDSRRLPIRYATAMAFSASCMMIFVTNSSFIYMQYFGVGPSRFSLLFALSVLGFMSLNLFSMWRLKSGNAGTFFRVGLTIQVIVVAGVDDGDSDGTRRADDGRAVHRLSGCDARARRRRPVRRAIWVSFASSRAAPRRFTRR